MLKKRAILKKGKEKPVLHRHHWVFSGAIETLSLEQDGEVLPVYSSSEQFLGYGYFNRQTSITGRMLTFDDTPLEVALKRKIENAIELRKTLLNFDQTNAYRLINGEGDAFPGLIIDLYDRTVVLQISTKGIEKLKSLIVELIKELLEPDLIYEKSLLPSRREEGLKDFQGILYAKDSGRTLQPIQVRENGILFEVDLEKSQKTGFFLDHREMREWVRTLAKGKRVLNAFSYTGGFTAYALAGGAIQVDSLDISQPAIDAVKKNLLLNGFSIEKAHYYCADAFQFLRESPLDYDLVILDPPAFAKKKKDLIAGCRGYKDINRVALEKMPKGSFLLTCSCSYYVTEELFQQVLFQASEEAKREVQIVGKHRLACDHPINIYHPESDYLKSFLLYLS